MWSLLLGCTTLGPWDTAGDGDGGQNQRRIVVSPGLIDFGNVSVTQTGSLEQSFTVFNLGTTTELVSGHDEPIGSQAFVIDGPPVFELAPQEQLELVVRYAPTTEQTDGAELLIEPTNETVRLQGAGLAPVLSVQTPLFEPVVLGCTGTGTLLVENEGSEVLTITDAEASNEEFEIVSVPGDISPGESGKYTLRFTPTGGGARGSTLLLSSNDPASPEVGITFSALGYEGEGVTENFRYAPSNPTDVLFVVAMDEDVAGYGDRARSALSEYVDTLRDTNVDYHLAAITSASPCPASTPGWVSRSDTALQAEALLLRGFADEEGPWANDLVALAGAAIVASNSADCLVDFRRAEADLAVILFADGPSAGDPRESAADLQRMVESPSNLIISGMLPLEAECGAPATDYADVIESWSGRVENLCEEDWSGGLSALAVLPASEAAVSYPLAEVPVPSTITVLAEGVLFEEWTWQAEENAILFDRESVPALGAEIEVRYVSSVACG